MDDQQSGTGGVQDPASSLAYEEAGEFSEHAGADEWNAGQMPMPTKAERGSWLQRMLARVRGDGTGSVASVSERWGSREEAQDYLDPHEE